MDRTPNRGTATVTKEPLAPHAARLVTVQCTFTRTATRYDSDEETDAVMTHFIF